MFGKKGLKGYTISSRGTKSPPKIHSDRKALYKAEMIKDFNNSMFVMSALLSGRSMALTNR